VEPRQAAFEELTPPLAHDSALIEVDRRSDGSDLPVHLSTRQGERPWPHV
jgi:hypothetical protein